MYALIIALAVIPGLVLTWLIIRSDKFESEPRLPLLICFMLGMLITIPVMYIEAQIADWGLDRPSNLWLTIIFAFGGIALVEELFKFILLMAYPYRQSFFKEPMDGIVYSVLIGMGFATLENILYADRFGLQTALIRALTAVPAHAAFAVILGYFTGLARFEPDKEYLLLLKGLGLTVLIHGTYDFFIIQELFNWLILLAIVTLVISIHLAQRMILSHQKHSPFRPRGKERDQNS